MERNCNDIRRTLALRNHVRLHRHSLISKHKFLANHSFFRLSSLESTEPPPLVHY